MSVRSKRKYPLSEKLEPAETSPNLSCNLRNEIIVTDERHHFGSRAAFVVDPNPLEFDLLCLSGEQPSIASLRQMQCFKRPQRGRRCCSRCRQLPY